MKRLPLPYLAMVLLILCCAIHVSGLGMQQESKAAPASDTTTQTIPVEKTEFVYTRRMEFEVNDYPASGANDRHLPHSEGTR